MKKIRNTLSLALLVSNALIIIMLLISAYSSYISPLKLPAFSCLGLSFPIWLIINCLFVILWIFLKRKYLILPLLGCLLCWYPIQSYVPLHPQQSIPDGCIKLLSYNTMSMHHQEKNNKIVNYLKKSNADIICLQEYKASKISKKFLTNYDIQTALKEYPYHKVHEVGSIKNTNNVACFSKYPIIETYKIPNESKYNGSVLYKIKIKSDTIVVFNCHLESNKLTKADKVIYNKMLLGSNAGEFKEGSKHLIKKLSEASVIRAGQADRIASEIKRYSNYPILVCGDFNDTAHSYAYHALSKDLNDAFTNTGFGFGISYNQNKFYFRIDHILHSKNITSYNCTIDRTINDSDHYPIWCYFKIHKK